MKPNLRQPPARLCAFTLVELLVCISIIALLIGLLLPALSAARRVAQVTACMSNSRQVSLATMGYRFDHKEQLPLAEALNWFGDNLSPRNSGRYPGFVGDLSDGGTLFPERAVTPEVIAAVLKPYLADGSTGAAWRCPSAAGSGADTFRVQGPQPLNGDLLPNGFEPNYRYLYTVGRMLEPVNASRYPHIWSTRNVAGLRPDQTGVAPSDLVVFTEMSTSYHSGSSDIYDRWAGGAGAATAVEDTVTFSYADGRVAAQTFNNLPGYLRELHGRIDQEHFGLRWSDSPHWAAGAAFP